MDGTPSEHNVKMGQLLAVAMLEDHAATTAMLKSREIPAGGGMRAKSGGRGVSVSAERRAEEE